MFENKYPYTDNHELNLDWFLAEFKKVYNHVDDLDATVKEFTDFVSNYFNNLDVQEEINKKIDELVADGTIQELLQPLVDEVSERFESSIEGLNNEINSLSARMDTFTNLSEGSTTGDAELIDGRIGANGITYANIGSAIRGQVTDLENEITGLASTGKQPFSYYLESGTITSGGTEQSNSNAMRSPELIPTTSGLKLKCLGVPTGCSMYICYYDSNMDFVIRNSVTRSFTMDTTYDYFRLVFVMNTTANESYMRTWISWIKNDYIANQLIEYDERINNAEDDIRSVLDDQVIYVKYYLEHGTISQNGVLQHDTGGNDRFMRTIEFHDINEAKKIIFNMASDSQHVIYVCYYDSTKTFIRRDTVTSSYDIDATAAFIKLVFFNSEGVDEDLFRSWITWYDDDTLKRIIDNLRNSANLIHVDAASSILSITMGNAKYTFKKVTDPSIRIDTWRLYDGSLIHDSNQLFEMWRNSDAEGAIKINGEDDFVSGYHGDEIMVNADFYADGKSFDPTATLNFDCDNITIYVESDVYHCSTSPDAANVAFKRYKKLVFDGNTVKISNNYICQENLTINRAAIALFQCNIKDSNSNDIFTNYSVNTDYKNYAVADIGTDKPAGSSDMTEATLNTEYGNIVFKRLSGSDQRYQGNVVDMTSRLKFYFDTIVTNTNVTTNEKIMSEFQFTIK